jgi:hypothetical protein
MEQFKVNIDGTIFEFLDVMASQLGLDYIPTEKGEFDSKEWLRRLEYANQYKGGNKRQTLCHDAITAPILEMIYANYNVAELVDHKIIFNICECTSSDLAIKIKVCKKLSGNSPMLKEQVKYALQIVQTNLGKAPEKPRWQDLLHNMVEQEILKQVIGEGKFPKGEI